MAVAIEQSVPLAPRTTLGLGGPARFFAEAATAMDAIEALASAAKQRLPVFILGGGSNLVVADEGFSGLVVHMRTRGQRWSQSSAELLVEVEAGETWDDVVAEGVQRNGAGIECLSGIPGSVGAAPVQNIGAYGQEMSETVQRVRVIDRRTLAVSELDRGVCRFGYRDSIFKREPERFVILSVTLALIKDGPPALRYPELAAAMIGEARPTLARTREAVLALRRKKSMLLDEADANHRSAGSFFENPVVTKGAADALARRAVESGLATNPEDVPRFTLADGRVKLAAGWLIERAGLPRGFRMGPVGLSSRHALALVHHGGGTTADLLRLALHVHKTVLERFGIALVPEPVFLGLRWPG
jgi:UDP-N-acetylmuramate dehydrogenase